MSAPTPPDAACACPQHLGRAITDPAVHTAWHALVVEQGGPAGVVDAAALREARGHRTPTPTSDTVLDERARASGRRASGALREACR